MAITFPHNPPLTRPRRLLLAAGVAALLAGGVIGTRALFAQVEGDRGIAPLANSVDIQVSGIKVDVTGKTGEEARHAGWKQAEQLAWKKLGGPDMPVESIDAMVSSVVIEHEQVGPHRYIATLGVVFDKTKASQYVGGDGGPVVRSAPLLVIPVLLSGGTQQVFEVRGPWQRAWAQFQAAQSPVDYVRPTGSGGESLVLTAGQPGRRSRNWWRSVLDQFDAADVIMPMARLERQWPGGPVKGVFTARYGPDNTFLSTFTMTAPNDDAVPQMLDQAVVRIDGIYRDALSQGLLQPDPTLNAGQIELDRAFAELRTALEPKNKPTAPAPAASASPGAAPSAAPGATETQAPAQEQTSSVTVMFASPDARSVDAALGAVRSAPGVRGAAAVSLAVGGTSVMRVIVDGGTDRLAEALRAQGWKVSGGGGSLRISR